MHEEIIEKLLTIGEPMIMGLTILSIVNTAFRIAMHYCKCDFSSEDTNLKKDAEENELNIDEDLKKYFNYEKEKD